MNSSQGASVIRSEIPTPLPLQERACVEEREIHALALHARAIQLDNCATEQLPLELLWERLATGRWRVVAHFNTADRWYFLVAACPVPAMKPKVGLLLRTLLGERQKVVAIDLGRTSSTLTSHLGSTLVGMGFSPRRSRVPALLVAAAMTSVGLARLPAARSARMVTPAGELIIVSTRRMDDKLQSLLSQAEWKVACLLVDGLSHREIAERRKCAPRTVANQIASVFRKLNISGRAELLLRVARTHALTEPGPALTRQDQPACMDAWNV